MAGLLAAAPVAHPSFARRVWGLWRLVHPFPSLAVSVAVLAIVPLADRDAAVADYVVLGLGMLGFQFGIGAANDALDARDDAVAKPGKPIPAGLVAPRIAALVAAGFAGAGLLITLPLDTLPWLIGLVGLALGLLYSAVLKRTVLSWLPLALALPLVPVWVFTALDAWTHFLWWAFPIGLLLGPAVHFANQLPDIRGDRATGSGGVAVRVGAQRTALAAYGLYGMGASFAAIVLLFESPPRAGFAAATGVATMLLAPRGARLFGRDGLFGVLVVNTIVLATVFLSAA